MAVVGILQFGEVRSDCAKQVVDGDTMLLHHLRGGGVALDDLGNVFTSHTAVYFQDNIGSIGGQPGQVYKVDAVTGALPRRIRLPLALVGVRDGGCISDGMISAVHTPLPIFAETEAKMRPHF